MKIKKEKKILFLEITNSFLLSLCLSGSLAVHFFRFWHHSLPVQFAIVASGIVLLGSGLYFLATRIILPAEFWNKSRPYKLGIFLLTGFISVLFYFFIPASMLQPPEWLQTPLPPSWHELTITPLEKNDVDKEGYTVHLLEVRDGEGQKLPFSEFTLGGSWQSVDNHLSITVNDLIQDHGIASYRFYDDWGEEYSLIFESGYDCGVVQVQMDDRVEVIDLNDQDGGESFLAVKTTGSPAWKMILSVIDFISLLTILFILWFSLPILDYIASWIEKVGNLFSKWKYARKIKIEWMLLLIFGGVSWWFLYQHAGGPSAGGIGGNDNLWYLYYAMFPKPDASGLNRFVYVYFLRIFVILAGGDGAQAVKLSWSFCIAASGVLVYVNTRLISGFRNPFNGIIKAIIAVILFFSMPTILSLQTSLADHPLMLMVLLCLFLYLLYLNFKPDKNYLLILIGIFFFLAFKIKESSLPAAILFLGFGYDGNNGKEFSWKSLFYRMKYIFIGVLAGLLFNMALDAVVLGDAFFGFRPSNWEVLLDTNINTVEVRSYTNWYRFLTYDNRIFIVFILSILSYLWLIRNKDILRGTLTVWLLPYALILFLSFTIIMAEWGVLYRYMMWSLPVLSSLAVQFLYFEKPDNRSRVRLIFTITVAYCLVVISSYYYIFPVVQTHYHWDARMFHDAVLMPLAFTGLIFAIFLFQQWDGKYSELKLGFIFLCLFYIIYPSGYIQSTWQEEITKLKDREWQNTSEYVYRPYQDFADKINYQEHQTIFISSDIFHEMEMLSDNPEFNHWSFSTFFGVDTDAEDFTSGQVDYKDLKRKNYQYLFLWKKNWDEFSEIQKNDWEQRYQVYFNDQDEVALLIRTIVQ